MSTKETLDSLSCFNDWKEICEGLDTAAIYAQSTDRYFIKEAILHIEGIQSIADELAAHVKRLESAWERDQQVMSEKVQEIGKLKSKINQRDQKIEALKKQLKRVEG